MARRGRGSANQLATVMGMVRAGLGISVVPALAPLHFDQPGLATRALDWAGLRRSIYIVRRRDRSLSLAAQSLHDRVLAQRPGLPLRTESGPASTAATP